METGGEFQFLEVMGTNEANEVVRHFSNLTAKVCWKTAKRVLRAMHMVVETSLNDNKEYIFFKLILSSLIDYPQIYHGGI